MEVWHDCWGVAVRVTEERLAHVLEHPEMAGEKRRIEETLARPDVVVQSQSDADVRLFHRFYETSRIGSKYLCAVVKWSDEDAFLVTAYYTDQQKRGQILWPNQ